MASNARPSTAMKTLLETLSEHAGLQHDRARMLRALRRVERCEGRNWMHLLDVGATTAGLQTRWSCLPPASVGEHVGARRASITWLEERGQWVMVDSSILGWFRVSELGPGGATQRLRGPALAKVVGEGVRAWAVIEAARSGRRDQREPSEFSAPMSDAAIARFALL